MPKKQILNLKRDEDQTGSQTVAGTKNKRRFLFPNKAEGLSGAEEPLSENYDGQETYQAPDATVKSRPDNIRIKGFAFRKRKSGSSTQQRESNEQEAGTGEAGMQADVQDNEKPDETAKDKPNRPHIQVSIFRKKKEKTPVQQEEPDETSAKEDSADAGAQAAEEKESFLQDLPEKFRAIVGKIFPEDRDDMLTYKLLTYLDECLERGEDPDWDRITRGSDSGDEEPLLPVPPKYITNYLLGNLLKADYVEGFVVEHNENSKQLRVTTGIQITQNGRKHLKNLGSMGRITALLRLIKDCTPGM